MEQLIEEIEIQIYKHRDTVIHYKDTDIHPERYSYTNIEIQIYTHRDTDIHP